MDNNEILISGMVKDQTERLDKKQLKQLQSIFKPISVEKDSFFIREGDPSLQMAFIVKGLFRSFNINDQGHEITKYFYSEGETLFSYAAYLSHTPSAYYIQALEDSCLLVADITDFERIMQGDYALLAFFKNLIDAILVRKETHASSFKLLDSVDRYRQFQNDFPGLEKRIKQHHLATYLGITPVSLSRIRKKLSLIK